MKIAIFGGSFDPVHTEHIRLAQAAILELGLDKLIVMPAYQPPHKPGKRMSPMEDRLAMCRLAFADVEKAEVSDFEARAEGTSYTYLTCRHFRALYPTAEIFWIVGTDMLRDFPTWKHPDDILENVTLAVCGRAENDGWQQAEQQAFFAKFGKNFCAFSYNGAAVSSTQIRVLAGAGMRLTPLVHENVEAYIQKHGLYKIENAGAALALEKPERAAHSLRVACLAAKMSVKYGVDERAAITAALFHDCAKNLPTDSEYLRGFGPPKTWGEVLPNIVHQFSGAYLAETRFGVKDEDVLNAIRFHTSGRANMSRLEKVVYLADVLEPSRTFAEAEELRKLFAEDMEKCLAETLKHILEYLERKGFAVYSLTEEAYRYYAE